MAWKTRKVALTTLKTSNQNCKLDSKINCQVETKVYGIMMEIKFERRKIWQFLTVLFKSRISSSVNEPGDEQGGELR